MKHETIQLAVHLADDGTPPTEFRIFSKGEFKTKKGKFLFDAIAAKRVLDAASESGTAFALDYAHAMTSGSLFPAHDPAESHKAAGWFDLDLREGELWAKDVRWTPLADKKLRDREFRYVSPTFSAESFEGSKRVVQLINVALTNLPATHDAAPLMLHNTGENPEETEKNMNQVVVALGLHGEPSEKEVLRIITLHRDVAGELVQLSDGETDPKKALEKVKTRLALALKLEKEVETIRLDARKDSVTSKVKAKISNGFLEPAREEGLIALGMLPGGEKIFLEQLDALTKKVAVEGGPVDPARIPGPPEKRNAGDVSDDELIQLGMTRESYDKDVAGLKAKGYAQNSKGHWVPAKEIYGGDL